MARFRGLFLLFFLSGVSGLIYESIWSRYIRQFVGSASTAQVLVLSLFMGGMSLGALIASRRLAGVRSPVRAYGVIEGAIGLYALAFPSIADFVMRISYDVLFPAVGTAGGVAMIKWCLAGLMILPPCVFLGMTFPLMSAGILREEPARSGEILSILYFTNSLGASLGAVFSGFVLVKSVGLPGTLMVAASLNILIMIVALRHKDTAPPITARPEETPANTSAGAMVLLFLAVAFGTGLSSFMYEISWIRLLSMVIGSATHSFEVMLSAFIFGMALGGLWVRRRMDRYKHPEVVLGLVQLIMGLSAIATLPLYRVAVLAMGALLSGDERTVTLWIGFNALRYLLCLLIMLPATFCAGMTLPLLTHVLLKRGQPEGVIGRVYGLNTLGAIAGAVTAGLLLMPLIGLKNVLVLGAGVDIVLGVLLLAREVTRASADDDKATKQLRARLVGTTRTAVIGGVLALSAGFFIITVDPMVLTSTVFRNGRTRLPDSDYRMISYVDGRTASVSVVDRVVHEGYRVIYTNGKPDASVVLTRYPEGRDPRLGPDIAGDEPNQILVGLIPMMFRPDSTHGALIGFGSGVTCHVTLGSPVLERLDTIEIEPEMVQGSREFLAINRRAYEDPRNHIWFDDAKAYFAGASQTYDFIISEPTNPWVSGVSSLFTVEFYREVKRYLKDDGVMAQWLQGYELSDQLLLTVLTALDQEFSDYMILRVGDSDWMIVAVKDGEVGQLDPTPLGWEALDEELRVLGIHDVGQMDGLIVANKRMIHEFLRGRTANSDAHPLLDTGAERARFMKDSAGFLHSIRWTPAPLLEVLGGIERRPYPREGIGDLRDPHVLYEVEQASLLMRAHDDPETAQCDNSGLKYCDYPSASLMHMWLTEQGKLVAGAPDWEQWFERTYKVFRKTAGHMRLTGTRWWARVLEATARDDAPADIRRAIELMDALQGRDGPRLHGALDAMRSADDSRLPQGFLSIAQLLALELEGAPAAERQESVRTYMDPLVQYNGASEDLAYQALMAYASRD
ncbi:MAG: fused MFS/spermidine synthase [Myxococcales bacterium]|nr:fused MFS/spermidine synthase [Myxococcales bacterium]